MTRSTGLDGYADAAAPRTVLIVDDHPLYRSGLKSALAPLSVEFGEAAKRSLRVFPPTPEREAQLVPPGAASSRSPATVRRPTPPPPGIC